MKVCFFDIDGTILRTGGAGMYAFAEAFDELFGVAELSRDVPFAGRSDRGIAAGLFAAHGIENSDDNWRRFKKAYVQRLEPQLERCGGEVLPGVEALIDKLHDLGDIHLALLTGNIAMAAKLKLLHYGLWDRFAFGGFGDDHPDRNDVAMAALDRAREHHGTPSGSERLVVIGDTPNDVRCARAINAFAVAVPTGHTDPIELAAANPDSLTPDLTDHADIIEYFAA